MKKESFGNSKKCLGQLIKDDKNINKKLLSIRLKIANKENEVRV